MSDNTAFIIIYITLLALSVISIYSGMPYLILKGKKDENHEKQIKFSILFRMVLYIAIVILYMGSSLLGIIFAGIFFVLEYFLIIINSQHLLYKKNDQSAFLNGLYVLIKDGYYNNETLADYFNGMKFVYKNNVGYFELFNDVQSTAHTEEDAIIDNVIKLIEMSKQNHA